MSPCVCFTFTFYRYLTVALYWPLCGFWTRQKTPTRGIHHPSMMDVHTKVLLSVENEIFLLHTNRRSVRIQTTFRPSPKVTLGPGTLLDSIQPRTLCLVPLHLLSGVKCAYITWYCCTILIPYCSEQFHLYTKLKRKSTVQPARETTQITIPIWCNARSFEHVISNFVNMQTQLIQIESTYMYNEPYPKYLTD